MFPFTKPPYLLLRAYRFIRILSLFTIGLIFGVAVNGSPLSTSGILLAFAGIVTQLMLLFVVFVLDPDHWLVLPSEEEYTRSLRPMCDEHDAPLDPALGCLLCNLHASGKTLTTIDALIREINAAAPTKKE